MSEKLIDEVICEKNTSLQEAIRKIDTNKSQIVFVVDENGRLVGSLSDGDIRRWLITNGTTLNFDTPISEVMNQNCKFVLRSASAVDRKQYFKNGVRILPVVDNSGLLVALEYSQSPQLIFGSTSISEKDPCFIIAEIGNNHQGDLRTAKKLIDISHRAGASCVKFQMRTLSDLYVKGLGTKNGIGDLGTEYTIDLLQKFQLSDSELFHAFDYCREIGIEPMCTPWDLSSFYKLEKYGISGYKVASADFTNFQLLESISDSGKPFICSTGMSTEEEILNTIRFLDNLNANYAILHCNSTYPTPYKDVNLSYLSRLKSITKSIVGYSGHERGIHVPVAAVALGAKIIEKHITLDKRQEGNDHKVSLLPSELESLVTQIRQVEVSMGATDEPRKLSQGEMLNREILAKSLVANRRMDKGEVISRSDVEIRSPGTGLQPNKLSELVGRSLNRSIEAGDFFFESDITNKTVKRQFAFKRPYGVPVRFHDFSELTAESNLDFVEFHLSYKDLNLDFNTFIKPNQKIGFAVHCPELFENDHLLDLASLDEDYRKLSIQNLSRVVNLTEELMEIFPNTKQPIIIVNAGGWRTEGFISPSERSMLYKFVSNSLAQINTERVTIAIQTMPPFPWHFGGQSYHNIFMDPKEIVDFCTDNENIKICFDSSHSYMACNYFKWSFRDFTKAVSPYISHIHLADALGSDGEGVITGEGDINFSQLMSILNQHCPNAPFIPETWQGHTNSGEGFWTALDYYETVGF